MTPRPIPWPPGRVLPISVDLPLGALDLAPGEVQARFDRARRSGTPEWLWPTLTLEGWRDALGAIERVTRAALTGASALPALSGTTESLGIAAYTSGMGPLLGHWLERGAITAPAPVTGLLRLHLRHNRLRMERLTREAEAVVSALRQAGVEPTLLKGIHTAHAYFPEAGARPMSDIDMLVAPGEGTRAGKVLRSLGYTLSLAQQPLSRSTWHPPGSGNLPRSLSLTHADDPFSIDLHESLDRHFYGVGSARLDRFACRAHRARPGRPEARTLGQPLLALLLAAHASEALTSLTLIRMVEIVLVVRDDEAAGALDWQELLSVAEAAGALRFAYPALDLAERLAPGTIPESVLERFRAAATPSMRRVIARLSPARAQRLEGMSLEERLMWAGSPSELLRTLGYSVWPASAGNSPARILLIYRQRAWRLIRRAMALR